MNPLSISRMIFDTIPQLYEARAGREAVDLKFDGATSRVYSVIPLSRDLRQYLEESIAIWQDLSPLTEGEISQVIEREWVQQKFAIAWLKSHTQITAWGGIIDYFRRLSRRTNENRTVPKTVVIEPGRAPEGAACLIDKGRFKVFDWLGASELTYFRVDEELRIHALEAVSLTEVRDVKNYRFYPDHLHPVISTLQTRGAVVVHMTANGSLLIADKHGLIASKRVLESWTVYDQPHLIEAVAEVMRPQLAHRPGDTDPGCVSCSLFQILFDISMKRHGGLIVIDHPQNLERYVVKGIGRGPDSGLDAIFTHSPFDGLDYSVPEVRKLVELSSVDGALILDPHGNLLQVGSMIIAHPSTLNHFGTREAAAHSAARYGATSFKVSADGDVSIYFTTPDSTGEDVHRFDTR